MSIFEESTSYRPFKYPWAVTAETVRRVDQFWQEGSIDLQDDLRQWNTKDGLATENVTHEQHKNIISKLAMLFTEMDVNVAAGYARLLPHIGNNEIRNLMVTNSAREITHQKSYALLAETFGFTNSQWREFRDYKEMMDKIDILQQEVGDLSKPLNFAKYLAVILLGEGIALFGSFACFLNMKRHGLMMGFNVVNEWSLADETSHVEDNINILNEIRKSDLTEEENRQLDRWCLKVTKQFVQAEIRFFDLVFEMSDQEGMTKLQAQDYIAYLGDVRLRQLGLPPWYGVEENPLPWMDYVLSGSKHTNFFESRVTDYNHSTLQGSTDYSKYLERDGEKEKPPIFIIYGHDQCKYCKKAMDLLRIKGREYEYRDIHSFPSSKELFEKNGFTTVPQIYHGNHYVGGYMQLEKYL